MRIYTRTGDDGETGLFGGLRVAKDELRVEVYGTVDELNSMLGAARSLMDGSELDGILARIQNDLFVLGADLAAPEYGDVSHGGKMKTRIRPEHITWLESEIDRLEAGLTPLTRFILPGGAPSSAWLHLARAICRRAERRCVALSRAEAINKESVRYLNRLSDLLFVMARAANAQHGIEDILWEP